MITRWFRHTDQSLCWRQASVALLNAAMLVLVGCAVAGLVGGWPYWLMWWALMARV